MSLSVLRGCETRPDARHPRGARTNVEVSINGEPREIAPGMSIAELLRELDLQPKYVAVERNRQLIPRGEHPSCKLQPHDELEIVTLVGGG